MVDTSFGSDYIYIYIIMIGRLKLKEIERASKEMDSVIK